MMKLQITGFFWDALYYYNAKTYFVTILNKLLRSQKYGIHFLNDVYLELNYLPKQNYEK